MSSCRICGAEKTDHLLKWDCYSIHRCCRCGLIFSLPSPSHDDLAQYYQGFMFRPPDKRGIERTVKRKKHELAQLFDIDSSVNSSNTGRRFLDYGGGMGIAYKAAVSLGLDAYYHDLDQESVRFVEKQFGLKENRVVADIKTTDVLFDYIFTDNVIEHVPEPDDFMRQLYARLNDGGILVIKTPHGGDTEVLFNPILLIKEYFLKALKYNSLRTTVGCCFKRYWHCAPPRHLFSFSAESLKILAGNIGIPASSYEVIYYQAPFLSNTITEHVYTHRNKLRGIKRLLSRVLALPFAFVELILQIIAWILVRCGIVSCGGMIMKIKKYGMDG